MPETGISTNTPNRIILDAGAMYRDWGESGEEKIGTTRGGGSWNVTKTMRDAEVDGSKGPMKDMKRIVEHFAELEVTFVEISDQLFKDLLHGSETSDGTHHTISASNSLSSSDFYTNIALAADVQGQSDPIVLVLKNALASGDWDITTDDEDEGQVTVTFTSHYDPSTADTPPFEIKNPKGAS